MHTRKQENILLKKSDPLCWRMLDLWIF